MFLELNEIYNEKISNFLSEIFVFLKIKTLINISLIVPDRRFVHFSIDEKEIKNINKIFYINLKKKKIF